jgi:transcriptional regulator MraZ
VGAGGDLSRVPSEAAGRDGSEKGCGAGAMFVGVHERQLDDKGRLALPSVFRALLDDTCYLTMGEDRCVNVFSRGEFERMAHDVMERVRNGEMTLTRQRALAHSATLVSLDKQGRVTIDDKLRTYARLEPSSKVIVSGNLDRAEVWCEELYDRIAATGRGELAGGQE